MFSFTMLLKYTRFSQKKSNFPNQKVIRLSLVSIQTYSENIVFRNILKREINKQMNSGKPTAILT